MTQEEKQLLFQDLSARLPYGVILNVDNGKYREDKKIWPGLFNSDSLWDAKPYLRPMKSMTEEEKQQSRWYQCDAKSDDFILYMNRYVGWLDSHYFDWRTDGNGKTMIEKGLALPATEDMYNLN